MYSVVLVMALAGSAEAPDCHRNCGCCGVVSNHGCQGCYGGGCYGGGYGGCNGGCYGVRTGCFGGCYGGGYGGCMGGCYGGNYGGCMGGSYGGVIVAPATGMPPAEKVPGPKKDQVFVPTPGTIVVTLPADAKLSIDGYVSTQTSAQRRLVTPALQPGQDFTYTLVAETSQNGQPVSQSQSVTVRAGQVTPVNFTFNTMPAAASR
jgi:uncharacterized protein (TIGR03000 family)